MPKTRARKKPVHDRRNDATLAGKSTALAHKVNVSGQIGGVQARPTTGGTNVTGMIMPGMVALGCWGMAFTFAVFSTDQNHLLFAGMAALMALMWSVSFGIRARKVPQRK